MQYLQIKDWKSMQQYKDRDPKWIKLDRELLDNYEFTQLSDDYKYHVIGLRLLAAKIGNKIPNNPEWIRARISAISTMNLQLLIDKGFIEEFDGKQICVRDCTKLYTEKSREETEKRKEEHIVNAFTLQQVKDKGFTIGFTDSEALSFFTHYDAQGWVLGNGLPISSLPSAMNKWKNNPKQNEPKDDKDDFMRKVKQYDADRDRRDGKGIVAEVNAIGNIAPDENVF